MIANDAGWAMGGENSGQYLILTRMGAESRNGDILLRRHLHSDLRSDSSTVLIDTPIHGIDDEYQSYVVVVDSFTEEMRKLVRQRRCHVRHRRKHGSMIKLVIDFSAADKEAVLTALTGHTASMHPLQQRLSEGYIFRQEACFWDDVFAKVLNSPQPSAVIRESPKWTAWQANDQQMQTLVQQLLPASDVAVGRYWTTYTAEDGNVFGQVRPVTLHSMAAGTLLRTTPVDPGLPESLFRKWAFRSGKPVSDIRISRKSNETFASMRVPDSEVESITAVKWQIQQGELVVKFQLQKVAQEEDLANSNDLGASAALSMDASKANNVESSRSPGEIDVDDDATQQDATACRELCTEVARNSLMLECVEQRASQLMDGATGEDGILHRQLCDLVSTNGFLRESDVNEFLGHDDAPNSGSRDTEMACITPGCFVEVGEEDGRSPAVIQILQADKCKRGHVVTGRILREDHKLSVLRLPGKLERVGTKDRKCWGIYHPAAKLFLGSASGKRWFADSVHGGSEGARAVAAKALDEWKQSFQEEAKKRETMVLCLSAGNGHGDQCEKRMRLNTKMRYAKHWRVVHADSVEHMLHNASTVGEVRGQKRTAEIDQKGVASKKQESTLTQPDGAADENL